MLPVIKTPCHNYTPVSNILPSLAQQYCTVCLVQIRIERVKAIQIALAKRGGIFESSTKEPRWSTIDGPTGKQVSHGDLLTKWRAAKVNCSNIVEALERLCDEQPDMVEEWGIDEALHLWELAKDECCSVPGCQYIENSSTKEAVEKEMKSQDLLEEKEPVSKQPSEVSEEDWETVKRRWQTRSRLSDTQLQSEPETLNVEGIADNDKTAAPNGTKHLDMSTGDESKALGKHSEEPPTATKEAAEDPKATLHSSAPRSVLKHRPSPSQSRVPRKSVSIQLQVTILPTGATPLHQVPKENTQSPRKAIRDLPSTEAQACTWHSKSIV